ncbi:MAG: hypothetical protein L0H54_01160 [Alcaligenaceae bacterium]|nr:hypothetical protein [Alcaligenaceae bacterium]
MKSDLPESCEARQSKRPWWREPWPWLLMLGPAVAVVGCVVTIVLAFQSYGDQAIQDGGVKNGLHVSRPAPVQSAR